MSGEVSRSYDGPDDWMKFGTALALMARGSLLARAGWNGKGMYIFLAEGTVHSRASYSVTVSAPEPLPIAPCLCMRTAQGTIQPGWLASQADMMASDWTEVDVAVLAKPEVP